MYNKFPLLSVYIYKVEFTKKFFRLFAHVVIITPKVLKFYKKYPLFVQVKINTFDFNLLTIEFLDGINLVYFVVISTVSILNRIRSTETKD